MICIFQPNEKNAFFQGSGADENEAAKHYLDSVVLEINSAISRHASAKIQAPPAYGFLKEPGFNLESATYVPLYDNAPGTMIGSEGRSLAGMRLAVDDQLAANKAIG